MAVLAAVACLSACHPQLAVGPSAAQAASAADFNSLLGKGDYAGAIAYVEHSSSADLEKDGVSGNLILDGLVDPTATTRPPYPLAEGFTRLERAAVAGRVQSIADLKAKFTTGINYEGKAVLMAPNSALAECWAQVETGNDKPATCVTMRHRLRVPSG